MSPWHEDVQASLEQIGKINANEVAWLLWGENVSCGSCLCPPPVLALFVKTFAPLISSHQSPVLASSISYFDSVNPAANLDRAGQFHLPRY